MSNPSIDELLAWMQGKSQTYGWGALIAYDRRKTNELLQELRLVNKRLLVAEQHLTVGNGNHVVMKHALVDHLRILLGKNHLRRINLVQPRNRLACG